MTSWSDLALAAPDLTGRVQARFVAHRHATLATLRRDGSPRTSGTEVQFALGQVWMGSMPGARKAQDLQRDGRLSLHSTMADEEMIGGDARISGRAEEVVDQPTIDAWHEGREVPPGPFHLFRIDVRELMLVTVDGDHLVIESWSEAAGVRRVERA